MEAKFELWAIVELFGHQKLAGKATEQSIGAATFIRVDVPEIKNNPAFTRLLNPSAIYAINSVTEDVAKMRAEQLLAAPIEAWDIQKMHAKLLELGTKRTDNDEQDNEEHF